MNSSTNLGSDNILKLLVKLSTPAIIAQLINVLYNIVDRIFIGKMENGELAMAGVGVAFPIILIINSFSALVGMGGAPLVAMKMGEKDNDSAEKIMNNGFMMLLVIAFFLTIFFLLFKEPILWAFGASNQTINYALDYIGLYILGTIFVQISLGMNSFINTQGFAKTGMLTVTIGAITNIVLDPIFIFVLDMGVRGAALATITSQAISAIWVIIFLTGKKTILKINKKYLRFDKEIIKSISTLGIAPFVMQSTESLVLISLNNQLLKYGGDLAVGAMTIMSSIMQIILLPSMGFTQGAQPIISYNFGAKNFKRVSETFKYCTLICFLYTTLMCISLMIVPEVFVKIFNNDKELVAITSDAIKVYFAGIFLFGLQVSCQTTFLALGRAKISLFLALLRKIILLIPLVFILPMFIKDGFFAVLLAEPIADIVSALVSATLFYSFYKKNLKNNENA